MISVIAEHSVDTSLLPEMARVLDLGCRNFQFTDEMISREYHVVSVDIDFLKDQQDRYFRCAISDYNGACTVEHSNDPNATRIGRKDEDGCVPCYTLETFSKGVSVIFWDLIKMDIEGSEYDVIMSLEKAPAKQLSIEFHLHTGIYGRKEMREMELKLMDLGYEFKQHFQDARHGAGLSYWDSLFILK